LNSWLNDVIIAPCGQLGKTERAAYDRRWCSLVRGAFQSRI